MMTYMIKYNSLRKKAANCSDISVQQKIINDLKTNRDRANNLKKEIEKEIDKLRQKFEALKCKHYS